jgi:hypothetical protein
MTTDGNKTLSIGKLSVKGLHPGFGVMLPGLRPPSPPTPEQTLVVLQALEQAEFALLDEGLGWEDHLIPPDELQSFATLVVERSGWETDPPAEFVLDVPDESEFSGWVDKAGVIHLHPNLVRPWIVLHELAHYVDPRDGHGPRFCANFLQFVSVELGAEAADVVRDVFNQFSVEVDDEWITT